MFDEFVLQLTLSMTGKRPGPLFSAVTGLPVRTGLKLLAHPDGAEKIRGAIIAEYARANKCLIEEAVRHFDRFPSTHEQWPSPLADCVALTPRYDPKLGNFARTLKLGRQLDECAATFRHLREIDGGFTKFREFLLESGYVTASFFRDLNEENVDVPRLWSAFLGSQSWEDADEPLRAFGLNAIMDWLACWDLEFCMDWIPTLTPNPLFTLVVPSVSPEVLEQRMTTLNGMRSWYRLPVARLIDTTSVLASGVLSRSIPKRKPFLGTFAVWAKVAPQWLANLRTGERKLTLRYFYDMWENAVGDKGSDIGAPIPLFVAAHAFTVLFVRQSGSRVAQIVTVDVDRYRAMWSRHLDAAIAAGAKSGTRPWPRVLQ